MRIQSPHCPSCGAPIALEPNATHGRCEYCSATLVVEHERVSYRPPPAPRPAPEEKEPPPFPQPEATLFVKEAPRFELSVLEQKLPGRGEDLFAPVELGEDRFALVYLRAADADRHAKKVDLAPAFTALKASLEEDGDAGLAANLALDALCKQGFAERLETAVLLFDPKQMTVTPYVAGCDGAVFWASSEEGRAIQLDARHPPLEKKMLREAKDHFAPGRRISLATHDAILFASAGYLGRGEPRAGSEPRVLWETLNANLGEDPLKIVTLAKNGLWALREEEHRAADAPGGDLYVAAVRAIPPPLAEKLEGAPKPRLERSKKFEVALFAGPRDVVRKVTLHADREVVIWFSPVEGKLAEATAEAGIKAVVDLLDRRDYGDNENPRQAGRDAYEAMATRPEEVRMAVIQLFDAYGRVKYFRAGWRQPIAVGPRGVQGDSMQQFDEGGEATVKEGARLLFLGSSSFEGDHATAESLATVWPGGKASRLYEALVDHWKTKKTDRALEKLALAVVSDEPGAKLDGLALVTGS